MAKALAILVGVVTLTSLLSCASESTRVTVPHLTAEQAKAIAVAAFSAKYGSTGYTLADAQYQPRFRSWWVTFNNNAPVLDADVLVVVRDGSKRTCIQGAEVTNGPCI